MFTVFVLGNIASGKSTACRYFESRGAMLIDLDKLAKSLYVPGSDIVNALADEFGWDILDEDGGIRRSILASRAFASPDSVERLNGIVHPVLIEQLSLRILDPICCTVSSPRYPFAVVEVSAPTGFEDAFGLADEILVISAPLSVRRFHTCYMLDRSGNTDCKIYLRTNCLSCLSYLKIFWFPAIIYNCT